jgi:hypothetical protein
LLQSRQVAAAAPAAADAAHVVHNRIGTSLNPESKRLLSIDANLQICSIFAA